MHFSKMKYNKLCPTYLRNFPIIKLNNKLHLINTKNITKCSLYGLFIFYFGILTMSKKHRKCYKKYII